MTGDLLSARRTLHAVTTVHVMKPMHPEHMSISLLLSTPKHDLRRNIQARTVLQGISGSSVGLTAARTSA